MSNPLVSIIIPTHKRANFIRITLERIQKQTFQDFEVFIHRKCSDIFLWTFLFQNSSFVFFNKKLNYFRRHEDSTTTKISTVIQLIGTFKELILYLKHFNLPQKNSNFIKYYFSNYIWINKRQEFNLKVFENNTPLKKLYFEKLITLVIKKLLHGK